MIRLLAIVCLMLAAGPVSAREKGIVVQNPHYGEVLFHFYQQDEFTALTDLLVSKKAQRLDKHKDEAELLLGGLYLSYGLTTQATKIFDKLLAESVSPAVHDRAWFFVGKARYERGWFDQADAAFDKVGEKLPREFRAEFGLLKAQSLMAQNRFDEAVEMLSDRPNEEDWLAYARFNLGVALIRLERHDEGIKLLNRVGKIDIDDAELRGLRDKANLALGFASLQIEDGRGAKAAFERVRLDGPHSNKALLGFGWANALEEDYREALTPWLELTDRDLRDSAVQEALLAVPFAFGELGAHGSAADYYVSAMADFDSELSHLDGAIKRARDGELLPALLVHDEEGIGRWFWELEELPDSGDARYLYHLIANNEFQDGLRSYRDLKALRDHLSEWRDKLTTFEGMVDNRILAFAERLPAIEARLAQIDSNSLRSRRDELLAALNRIESTREVVGLADEREREQWGLLTGLESNPAFDQPAGAAARAKHRVLKGTLQWQLDKDYRYRLWTLRRSVDDLSVKLAETEALEASTEFARLNTPLRLEEYRLRIKALGPRIDSMQAQIDRVVTRQSSQLGKVIAQALRSQRERLSSYRTQARFALASIYDRASVAAAETEGETP